MGSSSNKTFKSCISAAGLGAAMALTSTAANAFDTYKRVSCASLGTQVTATSQNIGLQVTEGDVVVFPAGATVHSQKILTPSTYTEKAKTNTIYLTWPSGTTLSCSLPSKVDASVTSNLNANSQSRAFQTSVGTNIQSRLNGGVGPQATRDRVFISTQNLAGGQLATLEWNTWVSAEGRKYNGGTSGFSYDVVLGADKLVGTDMVIGAMIGVGRTDLTIGANTTSASTPAIGVYFGKRLQQDLILDGYLSFGRPQYKTTAGNFRANRTSLALSLTGQYATPIYNIRPFARISGYSENQPAFGAVAANSINDYSASAGARFEMATPVGDTNMKPYFSAAMDYGQSRTTATGTSTFFYPRIGAGIAGQAGAGYLRLDADAGKANANTFDFGLRATYEFNF